MNLKITVLEYKPAQVTLTFQPEPKVGLLIQQGLFNHVQNAAPALIYLSKARDNIWVSRRWPFLCFQEHSVKEQLSNCQKVIIILWLVFLFLEKEEELLCAPPKY